mmetsp:Transcript_14420/g.31637  ORF Transcript_14420/g.31637 Transcript_14420/m.31637 type:complete len:285 (-) Transcript_14420:545-1399(-)
MACCDSAREVRVVRNCSMFSTRRFFSSVRAFISALISAKFCKLWLTCVRSPASSVLRLATSATTVASSALAPSSSPPTNLSRAVSEIFSACICWMIFLSAATSSPRSRPGSPKGSATSAPSDSGARYRGGGWAAGLAGRSEGVFCDADRSLLAAKESKPGRATKAPNPERGLSAVAGRSGLLTTAGIPPVSEKESEAAEAERMTTLICCMAMSEKASSMESFPELAVEVGEVVRRRGAPGAAVEGWDGGRGGRPLEEPTDVAAGFIVPTAGFDPPGGTPWGPPW